MRRRPKAETTSQPKAVSTNGEEKEAEEKGDVRPAGGVITSDDLKQRLKDKRGQTLEERIADSRRALGQPAPQGHRYFETHDGEIILGEADQEQIWSDRLNGGKGAWVLPRR